MNKFISLSIILLLIIPLQVAALQQTVGPVNITVMQGNESIAKYGIRNDENVSVTVKFNVTGDAVNYVKYPSKIILEPNNFTYVQLKAVIPKDYVGEKHINGTIYALKEGSKGGQVQLNVRLGKNINLNILEAPKPPVNTEEHTNNSNNNGSSVIPVIITIIVLTSAIICVVMYSIRKRINKEVEINEK